MLLIYLVASLYLSFTSLYEYVNRNYEINIEILAKINVNLYKNSIWRVLKVKKVYVSLILIFLGFCFSQENLVVNASGCLQTKEGKSLYYFVQHSEFKFDRLEIEGSKFSLFERQILKHFQPFIQPVEFILQENNNTFIIPNIPTIETASGSEIDNDLFFEYLIRENYFGKGHHAWQLWAGENENFTYGLFTYNLKDENLDEDLQIFGSDLSNIWSCLKSNPNELPNVNPTRVDDQKAHVTGGAAGGGRIASGP